MVSPTLSIVVEAADRATPVIKNIESSIIRFVGSVSAALATIRTIAFPIQAAAGLQTELLNVGKTTEFTTEQLSQLRKGLIDVSQRMNVTATDLARISAAGGQMGLGKEGVDGLLQFTETAARFASVLDVSAEEAGNAIAKLSNIFNVSVREAEKIGSLLNEISNNSTANGRDLVDMVQRIGTAGGTIGIKSAAALAATGRDLGLTVETVGTSFNKIFLDLQTKADDIAGAMGIPVEAWSAKVRTDGVGALKEYLSFLSKMAPAQRAAFAESTTGGGRIFALVTSLVNDASNGFTLLDKHLKEANAGFDSGTSAIKEQERVLSGLEAQYSILKNTLSNLAETVGREALPYLTSLAKSFQEWAKQPEVINNLKAIGQYMGDLGKGIITLLGSLGPAISLLSEFWSYIRLFLAIKIGSAFLGMASGVRDGTKALIDHARAWGQVLTRNKEAITQATATVAAAGAAAAKANAAGAAAGNAAQQAVLPLVTRVGAAIGGIQALNATLMQNGTVLDGLNVKYAQYQQRIAAATSGAQKGGLTTQLNKIDAQRQALIASSAALAQQQGILGRVTAAYSTFAVAVNAATGPLGKVTAVARTAGEAFVAFGRSATTAAGGAMASISARISSIGSAVVAATTTWAGFSAAMGVVAGLASRILFLWLPVVMTVYSLADAFGLVTPLVNVFKRLVGATTESSESLAKREAIARQALAEEESSIRAVASEYGKVTAEMDKAINGALTLAQAIKAAPVVQAQNQKIQIDIFYEMKNERILLEATEEAKTKLAELKEAYREAVEAGNGTQQNALANSIKEAEQELANLGRASAASAAEVVRLRTQQGEVMNRMVDVQKALIGGYDEEGFALVRMVAEQAKYSSEIERTNKLLAEMENAGAKSSSDDNVRKNYAMARGELEELEAKSKSFTAALTDSLSRASLSAQLFVSRMAPDLSKVDFRNITAQIAAMEIGFGEVGSTAQRRMEEMGSAVVSLEARIASLLARARALQGDGRTADANQYKGEAAVLQADLGRIKGILLAYDNLKKASKDAAAAAAAGGRNTTSSVGLAREAVERWIKAYAEIGTLNKAEKAAQSVSVAATQVAEDMRNKYASVFKDIQTRGEQTFNALADIQRVIDNRGNALASAAFTQSQTKEARDFELAIKDQETAIRHKALAQGKSRVEMENEINALHRMQDVLRRNFEANQETARGEMEVAAQLRNKASIVADLNRSMERQQSLGEELARAQASGDTNKASALAVELSRQADITAGHYVDLKKVVADTVTTMSKVTQGLSENGTLKLKYDGSAYEEVKKDIEAILPTLNSLEVRSRQAASTASQASATAASQTLTAVQTDIKAAQAAINEFVSFTKSQSADVAAQLTNMMAGVAQNSSAFKDISTSLQSIANTDLRTGTLLGGVSDIQKMLVDIDSLAGGLASKLSASIDVSSMATLLSSLQAASTVKITPDVSQVPAAVQASISSAAYRMDSFDLGKLPNAVQDSISSKTYRATIYADVVARQAQGGLAGGGLPRFAGGGRISGAGTGLSDSIMAMLSHGEYVVNAQTVRMFGSGFFDMLQQLGQNSTGISALRHALVSATIPTMALPRFATGGMAGPPLSGRIGNSAATTAEKMELTINLGGGNYKVEGNRDQVRGLYNALRMLER